MTNFLLSLWLAVSLVTSPSSTFPRTHIPPPGVIMSSTDGGTTWNDIGKGLPGDLVPFNFITDGRTCYAGTSNGLYHRTAEPIWQKEQCAFQNITGLFPGKHGAYVVSHGKGFHQLSSGCMSTASVDNNLPDKSIYTILETTEGSLLVGSQTGIYRSGDNGYSWQHVYDRSYIDRLLQTDNTLIACGGKTVWRSTDGGLTWSQTLMQAIEPFHVQQVGDAIAAISAGQDLAEIDVPNKLYWSYDQGQNWTEHLAKLPEALGTVYDIVQAGPNIIACSNSGIFSSADSGVTWNMIMYPSVNGGGSFKLSVSGNALFAVWIGGC